MKRWLYRTLIWLHPPSFRERFGAELLSIYDEAVGEGALPLFYDSLISLVRQWTLHSALWKLLAGAFISGSLVLACGYSMTWSFERALRRGNPGHDAEAKRRLLSEQRRQGLLDTAFAAQAAGVPSETAADSNWEATAASEAVSGIVAAFEKHPVVMIGEVHWLRQAGDFYIRLVRDAGFQQKVQDIVVEFASRNNQPLLDKYLGGEALPIEDVRHIWHDTTKVASWESPIYAEWLAAIREVNRGLPPARRLRVLAGDTPIDWNRIHTHAEWASLGDNDISFADVIEKQVLGKKRHALVVLGSNHVMKRGSGNGTDNTTTRIESRYPGASYVVLLDSVTLLDPRTQDSLRRSRPEQNPAVLYKLAGTHLGRATDLKAVPLSKKADALLYLGPPETAALVAPPAGTLEPAYLQEVDRRSMIEWGELRARKFLGAAAQ